MKKNNLSRRQFIASTAAATALTMMPKVALSQSTPNSNFGGVDIGVITYSWRSMPGTIDDILGYLQQTGISSVELMADPAEAFAGAPQFERVRRPRRDMSEEEREKIIAVRKAQVQERYQWRTSVSMEKYKALRKKFNDAGIDIYIIKFGEIGPDMPEDEVRYCFNVAKTLGAKGITTEISEEKAKYLAPFADEYEIMIGFHNHTQVNSKSYEKPFSYGKYLGMNLDIGHYVAGTNESPIPLIEKYAAEGRILSLHIKDRKVNNGPNMPFGQGDTPLALVLQLMKKNQYKFPAHIELEYMIPEDSDAVQEVKKCVDYCREVLEG